MDFTYVIIGLVVIALVAAYFIRKRKLANPAKKVPADQKAVGVNAEGRPVNAAGEVINPEGTRFGP